MMGGTWIGLIFAFASLLRCLSASPGDRDSIYRNCVWQCETEGLAGGTTIPHCTNETVNEDAWYAKEPLYTQWRQLNCNADCRYHCMMQREEERRLQGLDPVKYHGKWPFLRVFVFQEPLSAALSALNLLVHFTGWLSYIKLVNYNLPLRPQTKRPYYEYTGLWHIYGLLSINAWFWSSIFHTRDIDLTEKLDYSSAVALLGYALILSLVRTFNVKDEASRVMLSAPILAFVTTHILFLNFYDFDYGWNMKVCLLMVAIQLIADRKSVV